MTLRGRYFDGKTSAAQEVEIVLSDDGCLSVIDTNRSLRFPLADLNVSARIGDMQRRIRFPDGAVCEIADNDQLDRWLASHRTQSAEIFLSRLERNWIYALSALLLIGFGTWMFLRYGLPVAAERVVRALPMSIDRQIGAQGLSLLDRQVFTPSTLPRETQIEIRASFARIVNELPNHDGYRLEFRHGGKAIGANAFALPSGIVVMTDELVGLSADPNEITAVLAHEVGHVVNRHALRMLLQSSTSALVMFGLLGDVSSVSSLIAGLPALLTQAKYSRQFEAEADEYAYAWLRSHGLATHYFGDILTRLEKQHGNGVQALSYFASHPQTDQRVRNSQAK